MPGPDKLNEAYQAIRGLRAIRQFDQRPISDPDLHALLEAGRWTGSSKNRQNWSVVVVTDPSVKRSARHLRRLHRPLPTGTAWPRSGARRSRV